MMIANAVGSGNTNFVPAGMRAPNVQYTQHLAFRSAIDLQRGVAGARAFA
jgi:hypothetical protein